MMTNVLRDFTWFLHGISGIQSSPRIDVNWFHEASISDSWVNGNQFFICVLFNCSAYNLTNFFKKLQNVLRNSEYS
jgi:hypothetical protein